MSAHRWIRRRDGRVALFINDVQVGVISCQQSWFNWHTVASSGSRPTKAKAKRALLKAALPPKTKPRKPGPFDGWRWESKSPRTWSYYNANGEILAWIEDKGTRYYALVHRRLLPNGRGSFNKSVRDALASAKEWAEKLAKEWHANPPPPPSIPRWETATQYSGSSIETEPTRNNVAPPEQPKPKPLTWRQLCQEIAANPPAYAQEKRPHPTNWWETITVPSELWTRAAVTAVDDAGADRVPLVSGDRRAYVLAMVVAGYEALGGKVLK